MYYTLIGESLKALTLTKKHQHIVEQIIDVIDFETLGIKSDLFQEVLAGEKTTSMNISEGGSCDKQHVNKAIKSFMSKENMSRITRINKKKKEDELF